MPQKKGSFGISIFKPFTNLEDCLTFNLDSNGEKFMRALFVVTKTNGDMGLNFSCALYDEQ